MKKTVHLLLRKGRKLIRVKLRRNPITAERARAMTDAALHYARLDLGKVIKVQEEGARAGMHCPKLGEYWDDLGAVLGEIRKRQQGGKRKNPDSLFAPRPHWFLAYEDESLVGGAYSASRGYGKTRTPQMAISFATKAEAESIAPQYPGSFPIKLTV